MGKSNPDKIPQSPRISRNNVKQPPPGFQSAWGSPPHENFLENREKLEMSPRTEDFQNVSSKGAFEKIR